MDRNIQNVDEVRHETNLKLVNDLLNNGWLIITTEKTTRHDADISQDHTTYCLGHLIEEITDERWPEIDD